MSQPPPALTEAEVHREAASVAPADQQPVVEPEAMVDGIAGVQWVNGILHLALFADRPGLADNTTVRRVVSRIALTPSGANLVAETIKGALNNGYPRWLPYAATLSLLGIPVGLLCVMISPGQLSGLIFPVALFGIWFTGKKARELS